MTANLRGILLMLAAMVAFAAEDALIKLASVSTPTGQIIVTLGLCGLPVFVIWARVQGQDLFRRDAFAAAALARNGAEMVGSLGIVTALSLIPISTASAILQAAPIIVTAAAALILGEAVGWRRWTAVLVGFGGVILILQPGAEGFDPNVFWAVLGVLGLGARDIATRRLPPGLPTPVVASWGYVAVTLMGTLMLAQSGTVVIPPPQAMMQIGAAVLLGIFGYWSIIEATRAGDVSAITPFRYSRLICALAIGIFVFDERPDAAMLTGAVLVIGSGLYTLYRERRRGLDSRAPYSPVPSPETSP